MTAGPVSAAGWRIRRGTEADLRALQDLAGGEPLPPTDDETLWVATGPADPDAPVVALRTRRDHGQLPPLASLRLGWAVHVSAELGLHRRQRTLLLGNDLAGADRLGGWAQAPALDPAQAQAGWAALLAAALDAPAGEAAPPRVGAPQGHPAWVATVPGLRDAAGRSPVWVALGRHFHDDDPDRSRRLHGPDWEHHLAPLLPRLPIYASLLPAAAQDALGQALPAAAPLLAALRTAGFQWRDQVSLVDGGPVLEREA